ncbi:pirin family protein [Leekyejoonella antrihumi]|uniref:Pirin family protein n=1 Tax=Leekyejoonella antrihumi TaxID=1660198 RepID=A0A563E7L0_9MICO|nr:pirin family protein [Leekyejoonella antrihumi]TWP38192.1 pirin family protein [Leekyejoonella antrihumi]
MSNLERHPMPRTCTDDDAPGIELLTPRDVPLGGPRAMTVHRTLPQRSRSLIGAWCFVDHYGPDDVSTSGGMQVPGHPHTGLQTVSWLFSGEIEHRDSIGTHAVVRPGQMNLMTAGRGIAHSEFSTSRTTTLHGVQLWVALPAEHADTAPAFEHYEPQSVTVDGASALVFLGMLAGTTSPVATFSPLVGAEITVPAGHATALDVDPSFEHGLLVDTGTVTVSGQEAKTAELVVCGTGRERITLQAGADETARVLLLGGAPFGEQILMWWNFVGRTQDEITTYRQDWQRERDGSAGSGRFGSLPPEWDQTLPAPVLPPVRLRPRS